MKFKKYKFCRLTIALIVLAAFSALCTGMEELDFMAEWHFAPDTYPDCGNWRQMVLCALVPGGDFHRFA